MIYGLGTTAMKFRTVATSREYFSWPSASRNQRPLELPPSRLSARSGANSVITPFALSMSARPARLAYRHRARHPHRLVQGQRLALGGLIYDTDRAARRVEKRRLQLRSLRS